MKAIDYRKTLPGETITAISELYNGGESIIGISELLNLNLTTIEMLLKQVQLYVYGGNRNIDRNQCFANEPKQPYSTNESHYGSTGRGKYKWHELDPREQRLSLNENHDKLKQL